MSNLTTACRACNSKKSDGHYVPPKTPQPKAEVVETPATLPNGMTGLFLHTFKDDGRIHYQGRIVDVVGQIAMVQLYSWVFGDPTNIEAIPLDTICSNKVRLHRSHADWIEAGDRGTRRS